MSATTENNVATFGAALCAAIIELDNAAKNVLEVQGVYRSAHAAVKAMLKQVFADNDTPTYVMYQNARDAFATPYMDAKGIQLDSAQTRFREVYKEIYGNVPESINPKSQANRIAETAKREARQAELGKMSNTQVDAAKGDAEKAKAAAMGKSDLDGALTAQKLIDEYKRETARRETEKETARRAKLVEALKAETPTQVATRKALAEFAKLGDYEQVAKTVKTNKLTVTVKETKAA